MTVIIHVYVEQVGWLLLPQWDGLAWGLFRRRHQDLLILDHFGLVEVILVSEDRVVTFINTKLVH